MFSEGRCDIASPQASAAKDKGLFFKVMVGRRGQQSVNSALCSVQLKLKVCREAESQSLVLPLLLGCTIKVLKVRKNDRPRCFPCYTSFQGSTWQHAGALLFEGGEPLKVPNYVKFSYPLILPNTMICLPMKSIYMYIDR